MSRQIMLLAVISASLLSSVAARGQSSAYTNHVSQSGSPHTSASYPLTPPNAPQHHASTLQEGVLRGTASVMQAYFNGQVSHAQARILLAEARAREIQLRVTNMQAAQERRRLVAAERAERRRLEMENELLGQQLNADRMSHRLARYRLSPEQLDRRTGEICWPPALRHEVFAADTYVLEKLFAELAEAGTADTRYLVAQVEQACQRLEGTLRNLRQSLDLNATQYQHYVACHKFALGLKYEATCGGLHGSAYALAAQ